MNTSNLDSDIFFQAAESLFEGSSTFCCNAILEALNYHNRNSRDYLDLFRELFDLARDSMTLQDMYFWPELGIFASEEQCAEPRLLALCFAAAIVEWEQNEAIDDLFDGDLKDQTVETLRDDGIEHRYT